MWHVQNHVIMFKLLLWCWLNITSNHHTSETFIHPDCAELVIHTMRSLDGGIYPSFCIHWHHGTFWWDSVPIGSFPQYRETPGRYKVNSIHWFPRRYANIIPINDGYSIGKSKPLYGADMWPIKWTCKSDRVERETGHNWTCTSCWNGCKRV